MNQETLNIRIKKMHPEAKIPRYAKHGDAGLDLTATSKWYDDDGNICYGFGLAFEIPEGYAGFVFPRSSNSKKFLAMSCSVGVVDSGFRGEVTAKFKPSAIYRDEYNIDIPYEPYEYEIGDRVAQLLILPYPKINFIESEELTDTERGVGGYGSSGT
jgi:dUTP pyrophosphatase